MSSDSEPSIGSLPDDCLHRVVLPATVLPCWDRPKWKRARGNVTRLCPPPPACSAPCVAGLRRCSLADHPRARPPTRPPARARARRRSPWLLTQRARVGSAPPPRPLGGQEASGKTSTMPRTAMTFEHSRRLVISSSGTGTLDGNGAAWWGVPVSSAGLLSPRASRCGPGTPPPQRVGAAARGEGARQRGAAEKAKEQGSEGAGEKTRGQARERGGN